MERGMNERIRKLRKQSLETEPHIYMERAKLETEAYMMYEGSVSVPALSLPQHRYPFAPIL